MLPDVDLLLPFQIANELLEPGQIFLEQNKILIKFITHVDHAAKLSYENLCKTLSVQTVTYKPINGSGCVRLGITQVNIVIYSKSLKV